MPFRARTTIPAAVLALAGCTGSVAGTAQRAAPVDHGPLTDVVGALDLDETVGNPSFVIDVVPHPDGHLLALVGPESATTIVDTFLVDLTPGDAGPVAGTVRELPMPCPGGWPSCTVPSRSPAPSS